MKSKAPVKEKTGIPGYPFLEDFIFEWDKAMPGVKPSNYPPYNIIQISENKFVMEFALAGFIREEISMYIEGLDLIVEGIHTKEIVDYPYRSDGPGFKIIHKGISSKDFLKKFRISDGIEVSNVNFNDGMLYIFLEKQSEKKRKDILIG